MHSLQPFIERLGTVTPEGDVIHKQWMIGPLWKIGGVYTVIGVFHRSGQGLTVQQLQDDIPGFFKLLCKSQHQRPRACCEYRAIAIYSADGFDQAVIDWVHDRRPGYKRHMFHEAVLYDRVRNCAEVRVRRGLFANAHDPVLDGVLPAAVEALAKQEGHAKVEQVNSHSLVRQPGDPMIYGFQCTYEGSGAIYDTNNQALLQFTGQEGRRERYPYGFFRLPDFVVYDPDKRERFRVKRVRRLPTARFVMTENGQPICTIGQRSILLNRYRLDFTSSEKWTFHMPLFTIYFKGWSQTGDKVFVRLETHNTWFLQIDEGRDSPQLLAALAFIHRERLRCV